METCCATEECVNKPNHAACERHREVSARACVGWKLEWAEPGPELKVARGIVFEPFEGPKIIKAVPYQIVRKCGCCVPRNRQRWRNGIPDPWLEYLEHFTREEDREDGDVEERTDAKIVRKCVKITDFIWQKKGLALLQGIPDPWKSDLPCACEIKKKPMSKEESFRYRNVCYEGKSNKEFPERRSSNKSKEKSKRRSKNYDEQSVRRQSKSEEKFVRCAICCAIEPSKSAHVCYGGIVPACLRDYFVRIHQSQRRSKHPKDKFKKSQIKKCDEKPVRRSSKKRNEKVPTKRRNKSRSYENQIIEDGFKSCEDLAECRKKCQRKSIIKDKEKERGLRDTTSVDSIELSDEALRKSGKRCNTAEHKVEKGKTCYLSKKLWTSGFDKVKQRLQELENELKAKEAAKDLKFREMEQLSKLRRKAHKKKKRSGKVQEQIGRQKGNDWSDDLESVKSPISPIGNFRLKDGEHLINTDKNKIKGVVVSQDAKNTTCCNSKNVSRWLDEPDSHINKKLPKESPKSAKKTEVLRTASHSTKELTAPKSPLKSIRKDTRAIPVRPCTQQTTLCTHTQATAVRTHSPRRVSYSDKPQSTCRTCSPYSPNHRPITYCKESQAAKSRTSSPYCRRYQSYYADEPVSNRSNLSKSARCTLGTSSTASLKGSTENVKKFLDEINSRIEITQDALNSPCMKSVAVQPFCEETTKIWHCPGRELCPRMRERAGADEGSELFVRRVRLGDAVDNGEDNADEIEAISKFDDELVEDADASDCKAGAELPYRSLSDFKRRQKEIEELFVESFSELDC